MGNYFKPLRRKSGVLTLVMACVVAAGWVRSISERQILIRLNQQDTHLLASDDGLITWERIWPIPTPRPSRWMYRHNLNVQTESPEEPEPDLDIHWKYAGLGFEFQAFSKLETAGSVSPYTQEFAIWQVPYWSIVAPLTLLATWLLLSKQRPAAKVAG